MNVALAQFRAADADIRQVLAAVSQISVLRPGQVATSLSRLGSRSEIHRRGNGSFRVVAGDKARVTYFPDRALLIALGLDDDDDGEGA